MALTKGGSGYTERKKSGGHDGGSGGSHPERAGSGYLEKSKSGPEDRGGKRLSPIETGHKYGVKKAGSAGDASRLKGDGVGGPLPSA